MHNSLEEALRPQQKKKNPLSLFVIVVLALVLIVGGYWIIRQLMATGAVEITLPKDVAEKLNEGLRLEDGKIGPLRITPDGAENASGGRSAASPLAEGQGERPVASGLITPPAQNAAEIMAGQLRREASGQPRQKIYQGADAMVSLNFVSDLAQYLAENYWPRGAHLSARGGASSSATISAAGQRYGLELIGLDQSRPEAQRDYLRERSLVLKYSYTPTMLTALSRLYADRFADRLAQAGFQQTRTLNGQELRLDAAEVAQMLHFYANYSRALGEALAAYNGNPEAQRLVNAYTLAQAEAFESTRDFQEARYQLDNARAEQNSPQLPQATQAMKEAEQDYRRAMLAEERAGQNLVALMSKDDPHRLDDQSLLYVAAWAARRGPGAAAAHQSAAQAALFIGQVLDEKAAEIYGN